VTTREKLVFCASMSILALMCLGWHVWILVLPYRDDSATAKMEAWGMIVGQEDLASPLFLGVHRGNVSEVIYSGHLDEAKMGTIESLQRCRKLEFSHCTFEGKRLLAKIANMPSLEMLTLTGDTVTDEDLLMLLPTLAREPSRLDMLYLHDNAITDRCVDAIASLRRLISVNVAQTRISKAGFAKLCLIRPELRVSTTPPIKWP
jgi:hypothetical protein